MALVVFDMPTCPAVSERVSAWSAERSPCPGDSFFRGVMVKYWKAIPNRNAST